MKFSTRKDINAQIEDVFQVATDFSRYENKIKKRGVKIRRLGIKEPPEIGAEWEAKFRFRGRSRSLVVELVQFEAPELITFSGAGAAGLIATCQAEFIELSMSRTRMKLGIELRAKSIPARLMLQSMKFAKVTRNKCR